MTPMRLRLGALAFIAALLAVVCGACKFSGVSAVYMAIDSQGAQPRTTFYTDSTAIYCVAIFSSAKQDATVDFTIVEKAGPDNKPPLHQDFANYETVPGPNTETPVSFLVPPNGTQIQISCSGVCLQNGIGCPSGYVNEGDDSGGIGVTCCFNEFAQSAQCMTVLPYPVGEFECIVTIDGVAQGDPTVFNIDYPPPDPITHQSCPVAPPVTGIVCAGWVPQHSKCQGFNSYETCTCEGAAWNCVSK
jgi:hypothetical protein